VRYVPPALLVGGAVAIGVAYGWRALAVYAFFAFITGALYFGASVGGGLVRDVSTRRFGDRR
jgi:hypothetical protein